MVLEKLNINWSWENFNFNICIKFNYIIFIDLIYKFYLNNVRFIYRPQNGYLYSKKTKVGVTKSKYRSVSEAYTHRITCNSLVQPPQSHGCYYFAPQKMSRIRYFHAPQWHISCCSIADIVGCSRSCSSVSSSLGPSSCCDTSSISIHLMLDVKRWTIIETQLFALKSQQFVMSINTHTWFDVAR